MAPNTYFDLTPVNAWSLQDEDETISVTVTEKIKNINGVSYVVVNDVAHEDGAVVEHTDDWFAQETRGNVWYCGEISLNYETFDGDDPQVGNFYRREIALGEAEDIAEVIATDACNADCLVTRETTPLEPDVLEHKYYAPNVGIILELDKVEGGCVFVDQ